jgi:hypothetical protein
MYKILESILEIMGGIHIFLGFWLSLTALGIFIYCFSPNTFTLVLASTLSFLGFIWGIRNSIKAYNSKRGTMGTISKISSTNVNEED